MEKAKAKKYKIGKYEVSENVISILFIILVIIIYCFSPRYYSVTTGLYNQGTEEDQKNVETALGTENTEERFKLYFQYYNVIHELGHGLIHYNNGVKLHIVDEEQLVNDFAYAYWKYYGEEEKVKELEDIVNYAVENVGDNYKNGVDYIKLGKENSTESRFKNSFFNFNDYGWFQFSSVKHSAETNKSLEEVLKEMGFDDFKLNEKKVLTYDTIDEKTSTKIIDDAVNNINSWGLKYPKALHHFNKDPNMNYSGPVVKILGLFEFPDLMQLF